MTVNIPDYTHDALNISLLNNQITISGKAKIKNLVLPKEKMALNGCIRV